MLQKSAGVPCQVIVDLDAAGLCKCTVGTLPCRGFSTPKTLTHAHASHQRSLQLIPLRSQRVVPLFSLLQRFVGDPVPEPDQPDIGKTTGRRCVVADSRFPPFSLSVAGKRGHDIPPPRFGNFPPSSAAQYWPLSGTVFEPVGCCHLAQILTPLPNNHPPHYIEPTR